MKTRRPAQPGRSPRPRPERPGRPDRDSRRRDETRPPARGAGRKPARPRPRGGGAAPFQIRGDLIFGRNAVYESLRAGRRQATRLWIADGVREDERVAAIVELARSQDVLLDQFPRPLLDDLTKGANHQGIALETPAYPYVDLEDIIEAPGNVLVLDHIHDPQNFGTLLRSADACGVAGVILPTDRSVSVTPAVVNASAGAVEHLSIAQVPNLGNALDKLEASGRWIVGLDDGDDTQDLFAADPPLPVALLIGAEGPGLTPILRRRCQLILSIPMQGQVASLNAATAGSIALFDLVRRAATEA